MLQTILVIRETAAFCLVILTAYVWRIQVRVPTFKMFLIIYFTVNAVWEYIIVKGGSPDLSTLIAFYVLTPIFCLLPFALIWDIIHHNGYK